MRIGYVTLPDATPVVVRAEGDQLVPVATDPTRLVDPHLATASPLGQPASADEVTWHAPVVPQKIVCIGLNYRDHAKEAGAELPAAPLLFSKPPSALIGHGDAIRYRASDSTQVDYEAELGVIIGRRARGVTADEALSFVFGYTAANDVSARDAQFSDVQWTRGKGFDTFCPLGPLVVTTDEIADPQALAIKAIRNGETLQDSNTSGMIFGVAELISYTSRYMTLEPGDVILTGTPAGVGFARRPQVFLRDGDTIDIELDDIGTLSNTVRVES